MKKIKDGSIAFLTIIFYIYFQVFLFDFINFENKGFYMQNLLLLLPLVFVSFILFFIYRKDLIKQFLDYDKEDLFVTIKYWFYGLLLMYVVNILLLPFTNDIAMTEAANRSILVKFPFFAVTSMGIIAPFAEEICFRYSFRKVFTNKWVFVIVTSLLFGLVHINSFNLKEFLFILPYWIMGGALGLAYFNTKNIFSAIFMHMFNNVTMIFLLIVGGGLFWESFCTP